jgi:hypothetical protein
MPAQLTPEMSGMAGRISGQWTDGQGSLCFRDAAPDLRKGWDDSLFLEEAQDL